MGPLVWSLVDWEEVGAGVCWLYVHYDSQSVSGLMLKKLLPLISEFVVILNYLGVKHLSRLPKKTNCVIPNPLFYLKSSW